jgi:hypothetical protein
MDKINITLTPQQFIVEGKPFAFTAKFDDSDVSIISKVVMEDNIYKLVIKGDYKRSGECTISISDPDVELTLDEMQDIASRSMQVVIPKFIFEDYPESLKKVAEDEAAADAVEETSE